MRLLIAEDDPKLLKSLIHIFQSNKFAVDGVSNGDDALIYAKSKEYDGMILDLATKIKLVARFSTSKRCGKFE